MGGFLSFRNDMRTGSEFPVLIKALGVLRGWAPHPGPKPSRMSARKTFDPVLQPVKTQYFGENTRHTLSEEGATYRKLLVQPLVLPASRTHCARAFVVARRARTHAP